MGRSRRAVVAGAVVALVLGGCGDDGDDEAASDSGSEEAGAGEAETGDPAAEGQVETAERQIIKTATLVVVVDDVPEATDEAVDIAERAGGLLFSRESDLEGRERSELVLRTPPDQMDGVIDDIAELGDPVERQENAQDVTDQVVDLEGRLTSLRASVDRLRALIAEAPTTGDIIAIEDQLAVREAEIEDKQGQLDVLDSQVEMATVNVSLREDPDDDGLDVPGFISAIGTGISVLVGLVLVVVAVIGFALPFLLVAALVWWFAGRNLYDRYRAGRRSGPPPPGPPTAG